MDKSTDALAQEFDPRHKHKRLTSIHLQFFLFLTVWFTYGLTINSGNLTAFGLQQAGVEAYVERHHLYLEGSQVDLLKVQPVVDAFLYNGHIYPAKQPGQFMLGSLVYFPLRVLGLNYANRYLLTAALVTFLTASLVTALSAVAVFRITLLLQNAHSLFWPVTCALTFAFGTTAFAYSGIAWHDSIAAGYLIFAFYVLLRLSRKTSDGSRSKIFAAIAGVLLSLTIVTSMLPFFMTVVLALYVFALRRWRLVPFFIFGGVLGLAPLLVYNLLCFGNAFLLPNVAGRYSDTFFRLNAVDFRDKLIFYTRMLTVYVPVFWCGLLGLFLFPRRLRREQVLIVCVLVSLMVYILNIDANGTCQYGPRYLIPAMPFACVGLIGFSFLNGRSGRRIARAAIISTAVISVGINLVGALHGAMLCYFPHFAVGLYISQMTHGQLRSYPLALWIIVPFVIFSFLFVRELARNCRRLAETKECL